MDISNPIRVDSAKQAIDRCVEFIRSICPVFDLFGVMTSHHPKIQLTSLHTNHIDPESCLILELPTPSEAREVAMNLALHGVKRRKKHAPLLPGEVYVFLYRNP